jgi:hypothetical protein
VRNLAGAGPSPRLGLARAPQHCRSDWPHWEAAPDPGWATLTVAAISTSGLPAARGPGRRFLRPHQGPFSSSSPLRYTNESAWWTETPKLAPLRLKGKVPPASETNRRKYGHWQVSKALPGFAHPRYLSLLWTKEQNSAWNCASAAPGIECPD